MSRNPLAHITLALLAAMIVLLSAESGSACAVCYGDPSSPISQGLRAGIWVLLGVIGTVLSLLAALMIFWARRASKLPSP